jgi:hypothetical protein
MFPLWTAAEVDCHVEHDGQRRSKVSARFPSALSFAQLF